MVYVKSFDFGHRMDTIWTPGEGGSGADGTQKATCGCIPGAPPTKKHKGEI